MVYDVRPSIVESAREVSLKIVWNNEQSVRVGRLTGNDKRVFDGYRVVNVHSRMTDPAPLEPTMRTR